MIQYQFGGLELGRSRKGWTVMSGLRKTVVGAGGVLLRKGKILVIQEDSTNELYGKLKGMISIPMGSRLPGELGEETAKREFFEETGYRVRLVSPFPCFCFIREAAILIFWVTLVNDNEPPTRTREKLRPHWMKLDEFLLHKFVRFPSKEATLWIVNRLEGVAAGLDDAERKQLLSNFLVPEFV